MKIAIADLPDGFEVVGLPRGRASVTYDVTDNSPGVTVIAEQADEHLVLFPRRSYRHADLLRRLGYVVDGE